MTPDVPRTIGTVTGATAAGRSADLPRWFRVFSTRNGRDDLNSQFNLIRFVVPVGIGANDSPTETLRKRLSSA